MPAPPAFDKRFILIYNQIMFTIVETAQFQVQSRKIWSEDELYTFIEWIAKNPLAGDVIPGAEGARKIRWAVSGKGKRSGARVIYFNQLNDGIVVLLAVYVKSHRTNLSTKIVKGAKNEVENS